METGKDQILDNPDDILASPYGAGKFSYAVSKKGDTLSIRLNYHRRHFLQKFRLAAILAGATLIMFTIIGIVAGEFDFILIGYWLFVLALLFIGWVLPVSFFASIKKVQWEFSPTELRVINFAGRARSYPREQVSAVLTDVHSVITPLEFESNHWIVLQVPGHVYENGLLYLLRVGGEKRQTNVNDYIGVLQPARGDAVRLSELIAAHWNIPFLHELAATEEE